MVLVGDLMRYGSSIADAFRLLGLYAGKIRSKARTRPICQSSSQSKIELVLNLKTARVLGFTFPASILSRVDEVIE